MKRFSAILACALVAASAWTQDLSNSLEYTQLYIVGEATEANWSTADAPEMARVADGLFEWTGKLEADKEFKFLNKREFYKCLVSAADDPYVEKGSVCHLNFYATWSPGELDRKFKVRESGEYTVTVDLRHMKMRLEEKVAATELPGRLYATGTALGGETVEIPCLYGVEFKKVMQCRAGNILLMSTPEPSESTVYYGPVFDDVDLSYGKGYASRLAVVDKQARGWSVALPGDYTLYVETAGACYQGRKYVPLAGLVLVGGCCELNWNYWDESNKLFLPDPDNADELVWEGELRMGSAEEPDKFKILTAENWFADTFHPYVADALADNTVTDARISGGDDLKWTIQRNGYYRLTLNVKYETLKAEYLYATDAVQSMNQSAGVAEAQAGDIRVYASQGALYVDAPAGTDVAVSTPAGIVLARKHRHTQGAVASSLAPGLYLVSAGSVNKKILIGK